jgi:hypothetical protein
MIRRYPLLQTHIAEKACRPLIFAPHLSARSTKDPSSTESQRYGITAKMPRKSTFSATC